jgi:hypothetical protein
MKRDNAKNVKMLKEIESFEVLDLKLKFQKEKYKI